MLLWWIVVVSCRCPDRCRKSVDNLVRQCHRFSSLLKCKRIVAYLLSIKYLNIECLDGSSLRLYIIKGWRSSISVLYLPCVSIRSLGLCKWGYLFISCWLWTRLRCLLLDIFDLLLIFLINKVAIVVDTEIKLEVICRGLFQELLANVLSNCYCGRC